MSRKVGSGLTHDQATHLAQVLKGFLDRYDGNATSMARAWGISQPQLSQMLGARGRGAGVAVLCRLRMHTGLTIDDLLGLTPLGPTIEDKIRVAVDRALDELAARPAPLALPPAPKLKER